MQNVLDNGLCVRRGEADTEVINQQEQRFVWVEILL